MLSLTEKLEMYDVSSGSYILVTSPAVLNQDLSVPNPSASSGGEALNSIRVGRHVIGCEG